MHADDDPFARKAALRRQLKLERAGLAPDEREGRSAGCRERLDTLLRPLPATVLAAFWPLADEVDLRPAFEGWRDAGHTMALPRMQGRARPLAFHVVRPGDHLVEGHFGVHEPAPDAPAVRPRIVIVPLLGFDRRGDRLGYGLGFYDRTLDSLRGDDPRLLAIGVAFALQEVPEVPTTAGDRALDAVVTEAAVIPFTDVAFRLLETATRA